jgi:hypothetical protein
MVYASLKNAEVFDLRLLVGYSLIVGDNYNREGLVGSTT